MSAIVKEIYDAFRSAGVSDEQATAAARSIPISDDLATKADVAALRTEITELRAEMHSEITGLRAEMHSEIGGLRTELHTKIGSLRAEMKDLELRMTVKFYAALGAAVAAIKALDFLIG